MKRGLIPLIIVFLVGCGVGTGRMSEKKFTKVYLENLKREFPDAGFKITDDLTVTTSYHDKEFLICLDNAYLDYKAQPNSINDIMLKYMASYSDIWENNDTIDKEKIVPVIKSFDYLDMLTESYGISKDKLSVVYEKYNDRLIILYAEDKGGSFSFLTYEDLESSGVANEGLLEYAIENLGNIIPGIKNNLRDDGLYMVTAGGGYENSLILFKDIWSKENFDVKGDPVIAIPNRDLLLVTGSRDKESVEKMRQIAEKSYREFSYPITPYLFKWNEDKFENYD